MIQYLNYIIYKSRNFLGGLIEIERLYNDYIYKSRNFLGGLIVIPWKTTSLSTKVEIFWVV